MSPNSSYTTEDQVRSILHKFPQEDMAEELVNELQKDFSIKKTGTLQ